MHFGILLTLLLLIAIFEGRKGVSEFFGFISFLIKLTLGLIIAVISFFFAYNWMFPLQAIERSQPIVLDYKVFRPPPDSNEYRNSEFGGKYYPYAISTIDEYRKVPGGGYYVDTRWQEVRQKSSE